MQYRNLKQDKFFKNYLNIQWYNCGVLKLKNGTLNSYLVRKEMRISLVVDL